MMCYLEVGSESLLDGCESALSEYAHHLRVQVGYYVHVGSVRVRLQPVHPKLFTTLTGSTQTQIL